MVTSLRQNDNIGSQLRKLLDEQPGNPSLRLDEAFVEEIEARLMSGSHVMLRTAEQLRGQGRGCFGVSLFIDEPGEKVVSVTSVASDEKIRLMRLAAPKLRAIHPGMIGVAYRRLAISDAMVRKLLDMVLASIMQADANFIDRLELTISPLRLPIVIMAIRLRDGLSYAGLLSGLDMTATERGRGWLVH